MTAPFTRTRSRSRLAAAGLLAGVGGLVLVAAVPASAAAPAGKPTGPLPGGYKNLVVIYEENHSFDNLYGAWGRVGGQVVNGLQNASSAKTIQVAQDGTAYRCLLQNDVNLASPPLSSICHDPAHQVPDSHFRNWWFTIDDYIKPTDTTCPKEGQPFQPNGWLKGTGEPGGCTRDLVHRFYQEQYQINDGHQNRYVTGSDAVGLTMGRYDTKALPIYRYLHSKDAPNYVVADSFFQGAFGGSFLNHQWLIAARAPLDTGGATPTAVNSVLDSNGFPNTYPLYKPTGPVTDGQLTVQCANPQVNDRVNACGNFAVNTVQPSSPPFGGGAKIPLINDTVYPNIGDRMSARGITWNWYAGGWDDAEAGHPGPLFQFHHQPFNYFRDYAPGTAGRAHLQDETKFFAAAKNGTLPQVSFVKPYGAENEHPGYASEPNGSDHLVDLLEAVMSGPQAKDTLVVVTYDEFGGQWDHVSPPVVDKWGPGTRIPALVLSAGMVKSGVDHTTYDTTSIMATIERSYDLAPVASRDAVVNDLTAAVRLGDPRHHGQDGR
ncbi:MAG TPA: alkaline phosphatase family protein [Lapillicoccus sp.]|nr:alkaline phosphatase family protein [Lapillicoccus sp.]